MDFPILLDSSSRQPLYRQLFDALKEAIVAGRIVYGESLPSTRDLGKSLGLSRDTVIKTYEELSSQGYVSARVGAGTVVIYEEQEDFRPIASQPAFARIDPMLSDFGRRLRSLRVSGTTSGDPAGLGYGAPPAELLPIKDWRKALLSSCTTGKRIDCQSEAFGYQPLRKALAAYFQRSKGVRCEPEQIIVFDSTRDALDLIARLLVNRGDPVVLENPGNCGAREVLDAHGARVYPVDVDENGLIVDQLIKLPICPKLVHTSPSHHDPLGWVMPLDRRKALAEWSDSCGAMIVEDAFDSDYSYGSVPLPALQSFSRTCNVFYVYSFWKLLYPIVSTGCLVVPPHFIQIFERAKLLRQRNSPMIEQQALEKLIEAGTLDRYMRRCKRLYAVRRHALEEALRRRFEDMISISGASAGLHFCARFKIDIDDRRILSSAKAAGLPMASTSSYYSRSPLKGEFLLPFSIVDEASVEVSVDHFARLILGESEVYNAFYQAEATYLK